MRRKAEAKEVKRRKAKGCNVKRKSEGHKKAQAVKTDNQQRKAIVSKWN